MTDEILQIRDLRIVGDTGSESNYLVNGVSLRLERSQVLGMIGESGAGKTTIGLAALAYSRPGCAIVGGEITFGGDSGVSGFPAVRMLRGRRVAYVAQSAAASFNPSRTIYWQFCEMPEFFGVMSHDEAIKWAIELFRSLELPSPETFGHRYPHQVSGGQLQRAMVAMAMSCRPDIIVFDEPTTALDVTTQIEVLASIRKVIKEHGAAALYISHDLAVVAQIADQIMVLRHGRMVEYGPTAQILGAPREDYTRRLVSVRTASHLNAKFNSENPGAPILELSGIDAG
ncbi:MAG: ABC transporter ATP-binding protein [Pseudorhodoplanes sp.]